MGHFDSLTEAQSLKSNVPIYLNLSTLHVGIVLNFMLDYSNVFHYLEMITDFLCPVLIFKPVFYYHIYPIFQIIYNIRD